MIRFLPILLLSLVFTAPSFCQGCSDAGVCRLPSMLSQAEDTGSGDRFHLSTGVSIGAGDQNVTALDAELGLGIQLLSGLSFDAKTTYGIRSGADVSKSGLADVYLSASFRPASAFTVTGGIKIPWGNGDENFQGQPLPMDYQVSLGTLDVLAGISWQTQNWFFAAGLQQPVEQNDNAFFPEAWPEDSPFRSFISTRHFQRRGDLLFRAARILHPSDKITITAGLLPIIHLGEDERREGNELIPIEGSSGLTLNATGHIDYLIGEKSALTVRLGFPIAVRDVRPDGLTRSFALNAGLRVGL